MAKKRGNQEGSIYQRKSGKWQAQVSIDGRRIGKSFHTQKECREWIRKVTEQKRKGLTFQAAKTTVGEYLAQWLKDVKPSLRPTTYSQYAGIVKNHINPDLGRTRLSDLSPRIIQNVYSSKLDDGVGKRTVEMIHAVLNRSMKMANRQGLLGSNPLKNVQKPKHSSRRMQVLNEDQIRSLLMTADKAGMLALVQLAVTTGMRKGEILGLKWTDLDWTRSSIRVERQLLRIPKKGLLLVRPKTSTSIRTVKVGSATLAEIGRHLIKQDEGRKSNGKAWNEENLVFTSSTGTPKGPRNLVREFKSLLQTAGLPNIRFHDLRHTAASLMLMSNMPIMRITRQLGHAKPSTTLDIYGHLIPGLETEAVEKIDEIVVPIATLLQPRTS
jgi:integrase